MPEGVQPIRESFRLEMNKAGTMGSGDRGNGHSSYYFYCPACKSYHHFDAGNKEGPTWTFDGNWEKPTFAPSLKYLRSGGHFKLEGGIIKYCPDAPKMAGQNVPLESFE